MEKEYIQKLIDINTKEIVEIYTLEVLKGGYIIPIVWNGLIFGIKDGDICHQYQVINVGQDYITLIRYIGDVNYKVTNYSYIDDGHLYLKNIKARDIEVDRASEKIRFTIRG